jgi:3'(2'), 5'-bisphosphate nucleotidase
MKDLLSVAIQASIEAGKAIMKVYEKKIEVEIKSDSSPLTQADKNANDVINNYLIDTHIPIISEENKQLDYSQRKDWKYCWIVDPLDGTKEFIKRNGEFTVNIALIKNGTPLLGVIYVPVSKTLYYTLEDASKSYKIDLENEKVSLDYIFKNSIEIKPSENNNGLIRIVGSRSHLNEATKEFISNIENNKKTEIVSKGSSLKFCLVAEGTADVYPRFAPTMEWDTAAGQAICQAVGVKVVDNNTNLSLKYNKENLLNPNFLVSI